MEFLADRELRPVNLPEGRDLRPVGLALGQGGGNALEVVIAEATGTPKLSTLREVWRARHGGRASPLLLVVLHDGKASICGPSGEQPPAFSGLDARTVERICSTALDEPDRHSALRFLSNVIPQLEPEVRVAGITNKGLFASHELQSGVPQRPDWSEAAGKARGLLRLRGQELAKALGFTLEQTRGGRSYILRAADTKLAIAVFLERHESPDAPGPLFAPFSPVSYALTQAERENLDYVLVTAGPTVRLYPARTGVGTGRRGRTETYIELHLDLLPEDEAGYLWLLFSAEALRRGGTFEDILEASKRYAARLGDRLRDRVYVDVIPRLAQSLLQARGLKNPSVEELAGTYQMALVVLFRLLFIAYAEDKDLLPYQTNHLYRDRSLKKKAQDLIEILRAKIPFGKDSNHWEEVDRLFRAVDRGHPEWGVPPYNGGLFVRDPKVSPVGAILAEVKLPDYVFGPVLQGLLVDNTPDGWGPVDFRSLGVREFGTIYEGLLENELSIAEADLTTERVKEKGKEEDRYRPARKDEPVVVPKGRAYLHSRSGARKATGSYFTKHFAVEHLLDYALEPALTDHLARLDTLSDREAAEAFFDFRVADIAMGSGHFLVAAVDRIEVRFTSYLAKRPLPEVMDELARLRKAASEAMGGLGDGVPIEDTELLRRQIARRCIYGVDLNPIAVELARLGVWVHTFVPGLPLSFLDHNLVVGNSLVGIATVEEANDWLREIVGGLFSFSADELVGGARKAIEKLARSSDASAAEIAIARTALEEAKQAVAPSKALFDVLAAARIDDDVRAQVFQHASHWKQDLADVVDSAAHNRAQEVLRAIPPYHFPIAFPEVFLRERSGFDVILGNPPWEEAVVTEDTFLARHSPGVYSLSQRQFEAAKQKLRQERPDLIRAYERERAGAELLREVLTNGPFPGMGTGDPDLYKAFCWRFWHLARNGGGRMGVVLPRSVFAAKGSEEFRQSILQNGRIEDLTQLLLIPA